MNEISHGIMIFFKNFLVDVQIKIALGKEGTALTLVGDIKKIVKY